MTVKVGHAGYWMSAVGLQGMTITQARRIYQARLRIPSRATAFLNNRSIGIAMEHKTVVRNNDKLEFRTQQEVYVRQCRGIDSPLRSFKMGSPVKSVARWQ